jgi:hypothetical protein
MSLSTDRPLSQAMRYAQQFDRQTKDRMTAVYLQTLAGAWVEDRRSRGKQL